MLILSESLGTQLNLIARSIRLELEKQLASEEITPSQWMMMMALEENDHQVQSDLGKKLNLDNATITRIVDKLAERGFLERNQAKDDRRAQIVSLTDKGKKKCKKYSKIGDYVNQRASIGIPETERKKLMSLLTKIQSNLENSH